LIYVDVFDVSFLAFAFFLIAFGALHGRLIGCLFICLFYCLFICVARAVAIAFSFYLAVVDFYFSFQPAKKIQRCVNL
jgi:hypothetical protein